MNTNKNIIKTFEEFILNEAKAPPIWKSPIKNFKTEVLKFLKDEYEYGFVKAIKYQERGPNKEVTHPSKDKGIYLVGLSPMDATSVKSRTISGTIHTIASSLKDHFYKFEDPNGDNIVNYKLADDSTNGFILTHKKDEKILEILIFAPRRYQANINSPYDDNYQNEYLVLVNYKTENII